jgi:hypothetical protein
MCHRDATTAWLTDIASRQATCRTSPLSLSLSTRYIRHGHVEVRAQPRKLPRNAGRRHGVRAGISLKTQILYVVVFVARYMDLLLIFWEWISLYNFAMKIFFIASTAYVIFLMRVRFRCACSLPSHPPLPQRTICVFTLPKGQRMTRPSTHSRSSTFLARACSWASSSSTSGPSLRLSGPFPSGSSRSRSCPSSSCFSAQARPRRSRRTTSPHSAPTVHSTSPTGYTGACATLYARSEHRLCVCAGTTRRTTSTRYLSSPASSRPGSTSTFSTSTSLSASSLFLSPFSPVSPGVKQGLARAEV